MNSMSRSVLYILLRLLPWKVQRCSKLMQWVKLRHYYLLLHSDNQYCRCFEKHLHHHKGHGKLREDVLHSHYCYSLVQGRFVAELHHQRVDVHVVFHGLVEGIHHHSTLKTVVTTTIHLIKNTTVRFLERWCHL